MLAIHPASPPPLPPSLKSSVIADFAAVAALAQASLWPYVIQSPSPSTRLSDSETVFHAVRPDQNNCEYDVIVVPRLGPRSSPTPSEAAEQSQQAQQKHQQTDSQIANELSVSRQLPSHPNIVVARGAFMDDSNVYLVTEARPIDTDLLTYLTKSGPLPENYANQLLLQLASALQLCHRRGVVHRDIKLPVVYLDAPRRRVFLGGFRYAQVLQESTQLLTDRRGSPAYVSPEMLTKRSFNGQAADVWSLGVVFYVMLCGNYPFVDREPKKLFEKIVSAKLPTPAHLSPLCLDLLSRMLCRDPAKRITIEEVLQHHWFHIVEPEQTVPSSDEISRPLSLRKKARVQ